jgi:hypothetical protein
MDPRNPIPIYLSLMIAIGHNKLLPLDYNKLSVMLTSEF